MKYSLQKKSSFTLPGGEAKRVSSLRKRLKLRSNTAVVRLALQELEEKLVKEKLREEFARDSRIVSRINARNMQELDDLAGEGLDED